MHFNYAQVFLETEQYEKVLTFQRVDEFLAIYFKKLFQNKNVE